MYKHVNLFFFFVISVMFLVLGVAVREEFQKVDLQLTNLSVHSSELAAELQALKTEKVLDAEEVELKKIRRDLSSELKIGKEFIFVGIETEMVEPKAAGEYTP